MGSVYPGVSNGDKINKLIRGNKRVVMADRRGGGGGGRGIPLYPGTPPPPNVIRLWRVICSSAADNYTALQSQKALTFH